MLGRGGQGEVLRALDHQHGRWVALKVRPAPDAGERHFLLSEARILLSLRPHPNLPLVREDFFWEDRYVLVMDWVEGTDLGQLLSDTGDPGLPVTSVLGWLHQTASALGHLHNQGVVHGDVKPANLVLTSDGSLVLVDFGISTTTTPGETPTPRLGSPGYAAPELAAGEPLTPKSDVYSLAATAVALLSGAPPTEGPPDWEGVPNSAAIERALRRGLSIDAQRRPASPLELVERLQAHVSLDLPTGVVTFLLSDIEGSTARWEHDADRMADLLARHDTAIADAVEVNGGRLLKTRGEGDATFSVFARASDALAAALSAQRDLRASTDLDVRMALHSGEAQVRDGDYFGRAVNRAARLRALADGGQVLLSSAAADLVVDALPPGVQLEDLGQRVLRDLNRPERVFAVEVGRPELAVAARPTPADTGPDVSVTDAEPAVPESSPFVGRDEELEVLRDCLAHALIGEANVVLVSGEPGIGKSRLVDELRRIATAAGAAVVGADAPEGEFGWWRPIVAALAPDFDLDALASRPAEPEVALARLLDDVVGIVEAGAEARPLVVVVEDLHIADAGTMRVLRHLARALEDQLAHCPILVACTYRDTAVVDDTVVAEVLTALRDSAKTTSVSMAGLTTTEVARLLARLGDADPTRRAEEIHRRTDGNPFFVIEIAAVASHEGSDLPPTLADAVARRVEPLSSTARRVLDIASVSGLRFDVGTLSIAARVDVATTATAVDELRAAGLVESDGDTGRFVHGVVRDAVYDALSAPRRAHFHGRVGDALEARLGVDAASHARELAAHFTRAAAVGSASKAVAYADEAGRVAMRALAFEDAAAEFGAALEALAFEPAADVETRFELLLALGTAWRDAGRHRRARPVFLDAAALARSEGDARGLARAVLGMATPSALLPGVPDAELLGLLAEAEQTVGDSDLSLRARLLARMAVEVAANSGPEAAELAAAAEHAAARSGDAGARAAALYAEHFLNAGDPIGAEAAIATIDQLLELGDAAAPYAAGARAGKAVASLQLGDRAAAEAQIATLTAVGAGETPASLGVAAIVGQVLMPMLDGDLGAAADALAPLMVANDVTIRAGAGLVNFVIEFERGRGSALEENLHRAVETLPLVVSPRVLLIALLVSRGADDEARRLLEALPANALASLPGPFVGAVNLALLAEAVSALGDRARAVALYGALLPTSGRVIAAGSPGVLGAADRYLGVLAAALGRADDAARHLDAALALDAQVGSPIARAWDLYERGRLRLAEGDGAGARADAIDSLAIAERLGLGRLAPRAESLRDAAARAPLPGRLVAGRTNAFVGRRALAEVLASAWSDALAGQVQLVLFAGEPGIGKTRLAAEIAARVHAEGATVLYGACDEGLGVPYQPFVMALGQALDAAPAGTLPRLGRLPSELVRLVPDLVERVPQLAPLPPPLKADPETEQFRLFDAVGSWLADAAGDEPLLLVLDDLQWATPATVQLLRHVVRADRSARLMIVGAYRDSEVASGHAMAELLGDLRRLPGLQRLALRGLEPSDIRDLVAASAGQLLTEDGQRLSESLYAETAGNPFFVREFLRHLVEGGSLQQREGEWVLADALDAIPEGVREVVGLRVARLAPEAGEVLRAASAIGPEFDVDLLGSVTGADDEALFAVLDAAVAARLLDELPAVASRPGLTYRFSHKIVQTTLYEQLSYARRARLHLRIANALEGRGAGDDASIPALARHFAAGSVGGDTTRAVDYAARAGDLALERLANDEAVGFYEQAVELLVDTSAPIDEQRRCRLLISLGEAERRAGRPGYRDRLLSAAKLAHRWRDGHLLADALLAGTRSTFTSVGAVDDERVGLLESALELLPAEFAGLRARLLANLAVELAFSPDWRRRLALSDEAVALARSLEDPVVLADVLVLRSPAIWHASTLTERLAIAEELEALARTLVDPTVELHGAINGIHAAMEAARFDLAEARIARAEELAEELGQPTLRWLVTFAKARWEAVAGRLDEAERLSSRALELGEAAGQPDAFAAYAAQLFMIRMFQGRLDEIVDLVAQAAAASPELPGFQAALAQCYLELGRVDEARAPYEQLAAESFADLPHNMTWIIGATLAAHSCARLGDRARAEVLFGMLWPYRDQCSCDRPTWGGSVRYFLGLLAATSGRLDDADQFFQQAAEIHASIGARPLLVLTQLDHASALLARGAVGDARRARDLATGARREAGALGMRTAEDRARDLLERTEAPALPSGLADVRPAFFAGRSVALAELGSAWDDAAAGAPRTVLVSGEPGSGKTALAAEVARSVQRAGAVVLYGHCDEGAAVPYQPFVEVVAQAVAEVPSAELPPALGRLGPKVALYASGAPDIDEADADFRSYRLFDAFADWLAAAASAAPVLLVLDDLHWAGRATLHLLRHAVALEAPARLLIVGLYRDTEIAPNDPIAETVEELSRTDGVHSMKLGSLAPADVEALLAASIGRSLDERARSIARAIHAETNGNALIVRELLRDLDPTNLDRTTALMQSLPSGVRDAIRNRVARLSVAAVELLAAVAVAGSEIDDELLRATLEFGEADLRGALAECVAAGLLVAHSGSPETFGFVHSLARGVLYEDLSDAARARLHGRVATAMDQRAGTDASLVRLPDLARHYARAGSAARPRAIELLGQAGRRASRQFAFESAARSFSEALALLDAQQAARRAGGDVDDQLDASDDRRRAELLIGLGEAQLHLGDPSYRETLLDAAALARRLEDATVLTRAALVSYRETFSLLSHVDDERTAVLEDALAAIEPEDSIVRARLLAHLAVELTASADLERRDRLSGEAVAIARRIGDLRTLGEVLACRQDAIGHASTLEERQELCREQVAIAARLGDRELEFHASMAAFFVAVACGDMAAADASLQRADALMRVLTQPFLRWILLATNALRAHISGDFTAAEALAVEAFQIGQHLGLSDAFVVFAGQLGMFRFFQGRLAEVESMIASATDMAAALPSLRAATAVLYVELGRAEEARAAIDWLAADDFSQLPLDLLWLTGMALSAHTVARLDDRPRARVLLRLLEPYHDQVVTDGPNFLGAASRYLGLLCGTLRRWDEADRFFDDALQRHRAMGAPAFVALTIVDRARVLSMRSVPADRGRVRADLDEAIAIADAIGLGAISAEARSLAAALDRPPLPAAVASNRGEFVGRSAERALIEDLWHKVQSGGRVLTLIAGESGIGKTVLALEAARVAATEGATVLFGRCDEEGVVPYQPFVEMLRDVVRAGVDIPDPLQSLVPEMASSGGSGGDVDQPSLFDAMAQLLDRLGATHPVVVVVDDLHWADRPSLLLLRHLIRRTAGSPLFIVGTYRDTDVARSHPLSDVLADLRRERLYTRVLLRGLSADDVQALLEARVGGDADGSALAEGLRTISDGNPFFIEELVEHLSTSGALVVREGRWELKAAWDDLGVPEGVREVIGRRLSDLSPVCNKVLAAAAVLGRSVAFDLVRRMVDESDDDVVSGVEEAVRARLLVEGESGAALTYRFVHALVRETLYDELSLPRRQRMHLSAAQAIEAAFEPAALAEWASTLAVHYRAAGASADQTRAVEWSVRAAGAAARVFAYDEAVAHWDAAVAILRDLGGTRHDLERARILEQLGSIAYFAGNTADGGVSYHREALEIYEANGIVERAARVHSKLGAHFASLGVVGGLDIGQAVTHLTAAAPVFEAETTRAAGWFHIAAANAAIRQLRLDDARESAARARDIGEESGDRSLWANAVVLDCLARWERGELVDAGRSIEEAWAVADRADSPLVSLLCAWNRGDQLVEIDSPSEAARWYERELDAPRLAQAGGVRTLLRGNLGRAQFHQGRVDEARLLFPDRSVARLFLDDEWESMLGHHAENHRDRAEHGDVWGAAWLTPSYANCARIAGRWSLAAPHLDDAIATADTAGAVVLAAMARAERALHAAAIGDRAGAQADRDEAAPTFARDPAAWPAARARLAVVDGLLLVDDDIDRARDTLAAAATTFAAGALPWLEAEVRLLSGRAFRRAGDGASGARWMQMAASIYERIGATPRWIRRTEQESDE